MTAPNRMQEPITLAKPAKTMLAMRYGGGDQNFQAFDKFLSNGSFMVSYFAMGDTLIIDTRTTAVRLFGPSEPHIAPGTWAIMDDDYQELIIATDDAVLTMFTNLTD